MEPVRGLNGAGVISATMDGRSGRAAVTRPAPVACRTAVPLQSARNDSRRGAVGVVQNLVSVGRADWREVGLRGWSAQPQQAYMYAYDCWIANQLACFGVFM